MEITNKTLGLLLIAAIVVSLGGTFVSLNKLGDTSTTGYATNNQSGTVQLVVGSSLSILVTDDTINFGTCSPQATHITLDSENGAGVGDNIHCQTGTFPDYLTVQNDGNKDANVTVRTSHNGTTMFDTDTGGLAYRIIDNATNGGCFGSQQQNAYLNFSVTNSTDPLYKNPGCSNLSFIDGQDAIAMFAQVVLPPSTTTSTTAHIQFEAELSVG